MFWWLSLHFSHNIFLKHNCNYFPKTGPKIFFTCAKSYHYADFRKILKIMNLNNILKLYTLSNLLKITASKIKIQNYKKSENIK